MPQPTPDLAPLLLVLDLAGVFVFALSGALVAVRQALDLFGVIVLAGATGLGEASCATSSSATSRPSR